ncbi:MAG: methyltransferase domain-containing protein [Phycisphaerales bacterium]|nr:methyltransferase domain-containing protein [Phycisphaerales bacterium]
MTENPKSPGRIDLDDVNEWFHGFFEGITLDMWRACVPHEATVAEVDFLIRTLGISAGDRILDIACGLGRHSLELARRGMTVTAIDASAPAIDEAKELAATHNLAVDFHCADMRALPANNTLDSAFSLGNSFGYLDHNGMGDFLRGVRGVLRTGGRYVFDYGFMAESIFPRLEPREWTEFGDILFLEENRYDIDGGFVETTYTYVRDGETTRQIGRHYVYSMRELRALCAAADLPIQSMMSSLDGAAVELGSPYVIAVCG